MPTAIQKDASTIEALLPNPSRFIILYHGLQIPINGFSKIHIQFADRISIRDGSVITTDCPMITYYVLLDDNAKRSLYQSFASISRDTRNHRCIVRERCSILLGEERYQFAVFLNFIPYSMTDHYPVRANVSKEDAYVEMDFNRVNSSIYTSRIGDFYKAYNDAYSSRFELLDI